MINNKHHLRRFTILLKAGGLGYRLNFSNLISAISYIRQQILNQPVSVIQVLNQQNVESVQCSCTSDSIYCPQRFANQLNFKSSIFLYLLLFILHDIASTQDTCAVTEVGAVRLSRASSAPPNVGRVRFCNGSHWGSVCQDGWDHYDAAVVCRELGFTGDGKFIP